MKHETKKAQITNTPKGETTLTNLAYFVKFSFRSELWVKVTETGTDECCSKEVAIIMHIFKHLAQGSIHELLDT